MKTLLMNPRHAAVVLLIGLLGACASPEPSYFTIAPRAPTRTSTTSASSVIALHHVSVPGYLDRADIVARVSSYRVHEHAGERWSEPFDTMISRTLAMNLMDRIPNASVIVEGNAVSGVADQVVEVDIRRFDEGDDDEVSLVAEVGLQDMKNGVRSIQSVTLKARPNGTDTSALVATMSDLLATLSDRISAMVEKTPAPPR